MDFWLDFETRSPVNLKKTGTHVYAENSLTEVLLTGWAMEGGYANVSEGFPDDVRERILDPSTIIWAFNAPFERAILREVCGIDLPTSRFRCVMLWAYHLGFAGGLEEVCGQAGLDEHLKKMKGGWLLIKKFCTPRPQSSRNVNNDPYWTPETAPQDWQRFLDYTLSDVVSERALAMRFRDHPMPTEELELWAVDQAINDTGWPIDLHFTKAARKVYKAELTSLKQRLNKHTGLANSNSGPQFTSWMVDNLVPVKDLTAETVRDTLDTVLPDAVREALVMRQQIARTTPKKYESLELAVSGSEGGTGWLKGTMQMNGAGRTSRWAGRRFQPHNLTRPGVKDIDALAEAIASGDRARVDFLYPSVMDALSWAIRSAIAAPEGFKLVVSDYSNVESRILGWMSGCRRLNTVFTEGRDPYRDFASVLFNTPEADITGEQRNWSKPPSLGCGYQLGGRGLVRYAGGMGTDMEQEQGEHCVEVWRETYPEVPAMWRWLNDALMACITTSQSFEGYGVRIHRDQWWLMITLPSGRDLFYYRPGIKTNHFGKPAPAYWGLEQNTRKWDRHTTFGGEITNNICQAIGRDLLAESLQVLHAHNVPTLGHVHDEVVTLEREEHAEESLGWLNMTLSTTPSWAPGLIMKAEGYISKRYKK